jgi:hypothetical protein
MNPLNHDAEIIRLYLLGSLDPEAQQKFEERLLSVAELFEELLIAEDELVDDHIANLLNEREREQFENHFLATHDHRRKLSFARSLRKYVAANRPPASEPGVDPQRTSNWKRLLSDFLRGRGSLFVYATAGVLLFFGISLWLWQPWSQQNQRLKLEQEVAELNRTPDLPATALRVQLAPGLTRDSGSDLTRIEIPTNAGVVELQLEVSAEQYQSYQAVLQPADREVEKVIIKDLKSTTLNGRRIVPLKLPAKLLTRGDYDLKLNGMTSGGQIEGLARYSFRVLTR